MTKKIMNFMIIFCILILAGQYVYAGTEKTEVHEFTKNTTFKVTAKTKAEKTAKITGEITGIKEADTTDPEPESDPDPDVIGPTTGSLVDISGITDSISLGSLNSSLTTVELKDSGISSINWDFKLGVNWDLGPCEDSKTKLRYKDQGSDTKVSKKYEIFKSGSPLDVVRNDDISGSTYALKYYTDDNQNAQMNLQSYSGTSTIQNDMIQNDITINDIPYIADSKISISYSASNPVIVTLTPSNLVTSSKVKEVGIRVEYTLNGVRTGVVKRTKNIDGQNGSFTFTFKNIPQEVMDCGNQTNIQYSAYYIDTDNNEYVVQ